MSVTTDLSLFHRCLVKFLRKWCMTHCIAMCVTQSNLACYLDSISESIDNKKQVNSVYMDFSKVFDSICQLLLIHKLKSHGNSGQCITLLQPYILSRKQRVVLEGKASDWKPMLSGVPQGSQIGPLLFILYINDLTNNVVSCEISFYADDFKLFKEISSVTDCQLVQKYLDSVFLWCETWHLKLNADK